MRIGQSCVTGFLHREFLRLYLRLPILIITLIVSTKLAFANCETAEIGCAILRESPPPRDGSGAKALSMTQDGRRIVGTYLIDNLKHVYVWSDGRAFGLDGREAFGISGDGSRVVGSRNLASDSSLTEAMLWDNGIAISLGSLSADTNISLARGISFDGNTIIGEATDASGLRKAVRWRWQEGAFIISKLAEFDSSKESAAFGISGDGKVIVGRAGSQGVRNIAVRWLTDGRIESLGGLTSNYGSTALGTSWNGSIIVGRSYIDSAFERAFRWDASTSQIENLGTLTGYTDSAASAVSGNGDVIVGASWGGEHGRVAFRWTRATGMQNLNTLLTHAGVDMTGIFLSEASAISRNGRLILVNSFERAYLVSYIDQTTAGITTPDALASSGREAANERASAMVDMQALFNVLLLEDQRLRPSNQIRAFLMSGSLVGGVGGRYYSGENVILRLGLAAARADGSAIDVSRALIASSAAQYFVEMDGLRPFIEMGGQFAPDTQLTIHRSYANGARRVNVAGHGTSTLAYAYARLGSGYDLTAQSEFALWVELGRQAMRSYAYAEALMGNPFNATSSGGRDTQSVAKLRAQFTTALSDEIEATIWGAKAAAFDRTSTVRLNIVGFDASPPTLKAFAWAEYGARLSYALSKETKFDVFALGQRGEQIKARLHLGVAGRMNF
jgi:probable HAF family extracellular repeat protein